jgi:hypothetical protein
MAIKLPKIKLSPITITLLVAGLIIIATGMVGFIGAFLCTVLAKQIPANVNLPLGDVGMIAVDSKGIIYCSSEGYNRIQQFSATGQFIRGWASPYESPKLIIDKKDRLHVFYSDKEQVVYNESGEIIPNDNSKLPVREKELSQKIGNVTYKVEYPYLWPIIVKILPDGTSVKIIKTSFLTWMIAGPFQGWLKVIFGQFLLFLSALSWVIVTFFIKKKVVEKSS